MENKELISIIMPAYNAAKTIDEAIGSVLEQTYPHWELVVVDDGSGDGTLKKLSAYARADQRIRVLANEQNIGASQTRHKAVEAARGRWLAFLDSDDLWNREKLEKQVALQTEKNANLVFTGSAFITDEGEPIDWYLPAPRQVSYRQLLKQNVVSNSSVLVRKELFLKNEVLGGNMHEDFACWLRLLQSGEIAYGIDEPLLIYRLSATSKSGNKVKAAVMNWNAYRAAGLSVPEAVYYMCWYTVKGLLKYRNLRKGAKTCPPVPVVQ